MTPSPPRAFAPEPAAGDNCLRAQRAIVEGVGDAGIDEHLRECAECRFLQELSRDVSGVGWSSLTGDDPLAVFLDLLGRALASGDLIQSRYRIVEQIGRGGQGVVFRAVDTETGGETVALKLVRCQDDLPEASSLEVVHAHRVRHPGVCRVYHTERHGSLRLIVMEYVEGGHLAQRAEGLSRGERRAVFRGVCAAVQAAHEAGVLHLDLKPQNVLLRDTEPLVTDFGLSVSVARDAKPIYAPGGTAAYMAPEQREGRPVDRRADVYALGKMLAFLFPDPPWRVRRVIDRATEPDPSRRYADVADLLRDFSPPRRRWVAGLGAVAGMALAAAVFVMLAPAPRGHRAHWYEEHWGPDPIPADAWNVALNRTARALPSIETDIPPNGCARNIRELIDGAAQYHNWMHGYCFPGPRSMCVGVHVLDFCGGLRPEAPICMMREGRRSEKLALTVAHRDQVRVKEGETVGQLEPGRTCDEEYTMTVTLDRPSVVFAVRPWFVEGVPRWLKVAAEGAPGEWTTLLETWENHQQLNRLTPDSRNHLGFGSAPVTIECMPFRTRRLRISTRCSKQHPFDPREPGHNVWLYELEVFARVSPLDAWRRHLLY